MWKIALALVIAAGCDGAGLEASGSAVDAADAAAAVIPAGVWTCPLGGAAIDISPDGAYAIGADSGDCSVAAKQITFAPGLAGFCQLSGDTFSYSVASSTPDLAGAVMYLFAPGEVAYLDHSP